MAHGLSNDEVVFRSHLERLFAALFNSLSLSWEYEPYVINGYIPDFWFPESRTFIEVKGAHWDRLDKALEFGAELNAGDEAQFFVATGLFYSNGVGMHKPTTTDANECITKLYGDESDVSFLRCKCSLGWFASEADSYICPGCATWDGTHHLTQHVGVSLLQLLR